MYWLQYNIKCSSSSILLQLEHNLKFLEIFGIWYLPFSFSVKKIPKFITNHNYEKFIKDQLKNYMKPETDSKLQTFAKCYEEFKIQPYLNNYEESYMYWLQYNIKCSSSSILLQLEHNLKFLEIFGIWYLPFSISNV
jgi:hypothetical protein